MRRDHDVDHAVVRRRRDHRGGFEEPTRAKIALGLRQQLGPILVAGVEQQELLDDRAPRVDVQAVRRAVHPPLARLLGRVHVERMDGDGADAKRFGRRDAAGKNREGEEEGFHWITMRVAEAEC